MGKAYGTRFAVVQIMGCAGSSCVASTGMLSKDEWGLPTKFV